ncbi:MAG: cysteine desulfurase [Methanotrichaceae archaeon]|nr:cysteine desulfurase [Methanotrichaceae archaeon]
MNVQTLRDDFPILKNIIYLDNAATSLTPEPVLKAVLDYYRSYRANVGRGIYSLAQLADQRYREAHRKVADFLGTTQGVVIFTRNTTESINMVAHGLKWKRGDNIVTTLLEHHSNLLPWMRLERSGINLKILKPDQNGKIELSDFENAIDKRTKLVTVTHLSNVLGNILPIKEISQICRDNNSLFLVDGAQSVPHMYLNMKKLDCDFVCFSGHKMLGPTGTGVLWMKSEEMIEPLLVGGGMVDDVSLDGYRRKAGYEGFEAGTPNIAGGIGLGAAIDYLNRIGREEIRIHELTLTAMLLEGLLDIEGIEVYGPRTIEDRSCVFSFNVNRLVPHEVALMLDQASNILVRSGHHCCIPLMNHLGLDHGTVRASLYFYNTENEIERFLATLEKIVKVA